ncbi:hypothetical protein ACFE04_021603 [Oxalis oulophora]
MGSLSYSNSGCREWHCKYINNMQALIFAPFPPFVDSNFHGDISSYQDFKYEENSEKAVQCLNDLVTNALTHVEDCFIYMISLSIVGESGAGPDRPRDGRDRLLEAVAGLRTTRRQLRGRSRGWRQPLGREETEVQRGRAESELDAEASLELARQFDEVMAERMSNEHGIRKSRTVLPQLPLAQRPPLATADQITVPLQPGSQTILSSEHGRRPRRSSRLVQSNLLWLAMPSGERRGRKVQETTGSNGDNTKE